MRDPPSLPWTALAGGAGVWLVLSIVAFTSELSAKASNPRGPQRNVTLPVLLLVLAALWLAAGLLARRLPALRLSWPDFGGVLILGGGLALAIQLSIRLAASPHFGGRASAFDFGLKCSSGEAEDCMEQNVAFEPNFNSFGHTIQGCFSLILFPGAFLLQRPAKTGLEAASCVVTIYPIYNIVKRTIKQGSGFAASSFANNGAEWAMGFVLGLSCLLVCTAVSQHRQSSRCDRKTAPAHSTATMAVARTIWTLRVVFGLALCTVSFVAAVLLGLSWNNTAAGKHENAQDTVVLASMLAVALIFVLAALGTEYNVRRRAQVIELENVAMTDMPERQESTEGDPVELELPGSGRA